ncbi:MAG: hypothetical protein JO045_14000 [Mycobacterium sp.]|jgi:hypothetical protein|nr:hypothetical protein [Mycobacterium sp.]
MSARPITRAIGTAAGAFLAAGLIPLATSPVAHACTDDTLGCDPDFISATDPLFKLFGITDIGAADPDDTFEGMILEIPKLGITDVLTSGKDTSDLLAGLGVTLPDDTGVGTASITVNTFTDSMDPALNSMTTIPFTDPLAGLWDILVANDFFGL